MLNFGAQNHGHSENEPATLIVSVKFDDSCSNPGVGHVFLLSIS